MKSLNTLEDIQDGLDALLALDPRLTAIAQAAGPLPLRRRSTDLKEACPYCRRSTGVGCQCNRDLFAV
ncbi:hypothetical protein [Breoghania sp.]|uniref:hypothetical protein n=1 Tax=Breoghania sp. TaxID=2065378 RepID=UPI003204CDF3